LSRPGGGGLVSDADVEEFSAVVAKDHEAEEQAKGQGRYDEEVDGRNVVTVSSQEGSPRRRRMTGGAAHVLGDGEGGDFIAEEAEFGVNPAPAPDFLWFMSSDFFLRLSQLLPRHRREVVLVVIRRVALPHDEDDLQPLCAQRPERLAMRMSPRPLLVVVRARPFTRTEREERDLIDHVPQRRVAGEAEVTTRCLPLRFVPGTAPAWA
jgi:hypothetical protein